MKITMLYECLIWSGLLISPLSAGLSFGGTYCAINTCDGAGKTYCDSGCCYDHGITQCCPNTMMILIGCVFGVLLTLMVLAGVFIVCMQRRRRKLHALSKYKDCETQTLDKPPSHQNPSSGQPPIPERKPVLPPDDIMDIF